MGKVYGNDFYAVILVGKCKSLRRKSGKARRNVLYSFSKYEKRESGEERNMDVLAQLNRAMAYLKSQEQSCQKPCRTFHSSHVPPSCLSQVMVIFLVYSFEIHLPYAAVSLSLTAFFSRKATRFA